MDDVRRTFGPLPLPRSVAFVLTRERNNMKAADWVSGSQKLA